jgi:hypothetical protein
MKPILLAAVAAIALASPASAQDYNSMQLQMQAQQQQMELQHQMERLQDQQRDQQQRIYNQSCRCGPAAAGTTVRNLIAEKASTLTDMGRVIAPGLFSFKGTRRHGRQRSLTSSSERQPVAQARSNRQDALAGRSPGQPAHVPWCKRAGQDASQRLLRASKAD